MWYIRNKASDKSSATTTIGTTTTTNMQVWLHNSFWPRNCSLAVSASASKNFEYIDSTMYGLLNDKFSSAFPCLMKGTYVVIYRRNFPMGKHFYLFPLTNISLLISQRYLSSAVREFYSMMKNYSFSQSTRAPESVKYTAYPLCSPIVYLFFSTFFQQSRSLNQNNLLHLAL